MKRTVTSIVTGHPTTDGAGVKLDRILSFSHTTAFDPYLMLDSFGSDSTVPGPGFPWHPHRGIITISYILKGSITHEDSLGNKGTITVGGVQWMKAASGIVHQEMPKPGPQGIRGLQFWLNLPANQKMSAPEYGDISAEKFEVITEASQTVKVVAGAYKEARGLLSFERTEPEMYHVSFTKSGKMLLPTSREKNFFIIPFSLGASVAGEKLVPFAAHLLTPGEELEVLGEAGSEIFIVGGEKLKEPIAWEGPIVMNTREELMVAFREYQEGTFIK